MKKHLYRKGLCRYGHRLPVATILALVFLCATPHISSAGNEHRIRENAAAYWHGRIWYAEHPMSRNNNSHTWDFKIYSYDPRNRVGPRLEKVVTYPELDMSLLAGEEGIWIISARAAGFLRNNKFEMLNTNKSFFDASLPFLHQVKPAVIENRDGQLSVQILEGNKWIEKSSFSIKRKYGYEDVKSYLQAISINGEIHLFMRDDGVLYWHKGLPKNNGNKPVSWKRIAKISGVIYAVPVEGKPAVFYYAADRLICRIKGLIYENGKWIGFYNGPKLFIPTLINDFGVYPSGIKNDFALMGSYFLGNSYSQMYERGRPIALLRFGSLNGLYIMFLGLLLIIPITIIEIFFSVRPSLRYTKAGITIYKETREYPKSVLSDASLMNRDFSDSKFYTFRKYPAKNTIIMRMKFLAPLKMKTRSGNSSSSTNVILRIKETPTKTIIMLESKLSLFIVGFLMIVCCITCVLFYVMSQDEIILILTCGPAILFMLIFTFYMAFKRLREEIKNSFKQIYIYLGLEKAVPEEPQI